MPSPSTASASASDLETWFGRMEEAEQAEGWLAWCRDRGIFIASANEFVDALANELRCLAGTILEIGSGVGELAAELGRRNVSVIATDPAAVAPNVIRMSAREALKLYKPATVLSSFLPVDAGVEADVLRCASVQRYLYLGPIIMGRVGPEALWNVTGWSAKRLLEVEDVLISRLDILPDFSRRTHLRGAGAVLLQRVQ